METWNNSLYNIWRADLSPWLDAPASGGERAR